MTTKNDNKKTIFKFEDNLTIEGKILTQKHDDHTIKGNKFYSDMFPFKKLN